MSTLTDADKIICDRLTQAGMRRTVATAIAEDIADELDSNNLLNTKQED